MNHRTPFFALTLLCLCALADAQSSSTLTQIHKHLQDWRWMARENAFVFVGEVETMRPVQTHRCQSGSEQKLEYIVRDLLWNNTDSFLRNGSLVTKGFVDCIQKPLPAPFKKGSKIIALCAAPPSLGDICSPPVEATESNLNRVRRWIATLQSTQVDPALMQIHERLLDDADLMRKPTGHGQEFRINGEVLRALMFMGEVKRIAPVPPILRVTMPRMMDIGISRVLFGDERESQIRIACRANRCSGATVGARIIAYCRLGRVGAQDCLASIASPETAVPKLNDWLLEAGLLRRSDP